MGAVFGFPRLPSMPMIFVMVKAHSGIAEATNTARSKNLVTVPTSHAPPDAPRWASTDISGRRPRPCADRRSAANMVNHSLPSPPLSFLTAFISHYSTKLKRFATKRARLVKPRAMSRAGAVQGLFHG
jgi:hypothetical protein